ncbi:hypothetical protein BKA93DRAFT_793015 [Sparassis latifolia]
MSAFRSIYKLSRTLPSTVRAFHSPFASLSSPLTSPRPPTANVSPLYEKQTEPSPEPQMSGAGTRTYVVSAPDPADTPYEVPSGAYPTSAPYQSYPGTEAPVLEGEHFSSTSSTLAHPLTTAAVPQNPTGVGESAAVRHSEAPGELHRRGGSFGGLGLMDAKTTTQGKGALAERNLPPLDFAGEEHSKLAVDNITTGKVRE